MEFNPPGPRLAYSVAGAQVQVRFTPKVNATCLLQSSSDLADWTTEEIMTTASSPIDYVRQFDLGAAPKRFFRLEVQ